MFSLVRKTTFLISVIIIITSCSGKIIRLDQDGGVAKFKVGTEFQVQLDCPAEDGYFWEAVGFNGQVIRQLGPPEIITSAQSNHAKKTYIFHFQTLNPGNALLKINLFGPDSKEGEPMDDFEIMIISGLMG